MPFPIVKAVAFLRQSAISIHTTRPNYTFVTNITFPVKLMIQLLHNHNDARKYDMALWILYLPSYITGTEAWSYAIPIGATRRFTDWS